MARIGPAKVRARYGVEPGQVPDFIALRGDPSDKLPGAKGVDAVGAAALLRKFAARRETLGHLRGWPIQQPEGDDRPSIIAAFVSLLGIAKLEVSVMVDIAGHVVGDRTGAAGTTISGLRPGAVAPDGIVASLKSEVGKVPERGSIGAALPGKELVTVEAALLASASAAVVPGLHVPAIVDMPNGEIIGSGATGGVETTEEVEATTGGEAKEGEDKDINSVVTVTLLAAGVAVLVNSVVGHMMIAPSEVPGIGPTLPRLN